MRKSFSLRINLYQFCSFAHEKNLCKEGVNLVIAPLLQQQKALHFFQRKPLGLSLTDKFLKLMFNLQHAKLCSAICGNCYCMNGKTSNITVQILRELSFGFYCPWLGKVLSHFSNSSSCELGDIDVHLLVRKLKAC